MMGSAVPAFNLLGASMRRSPRYRETAWRPLLSSLAVGLVLGTLLLTEMQRRLQHERDVLASLQAQWEQLQARQRALAAEMDARRSLEEQQQALERQRARWHQAGRLLQQLARAPAGSTYLQLSELKLDDQGLMLSGQIASSRLQVWMSELRLPWGPAYLLEAGTLVTDDPVMHGQPELSRFVIRFPEPTDGPGDRP